MSSEHAVRHQTPATESAEALVEDLEVGTKLIPFDNAPGDDMLVMETSLRPRQLEIQDQRRREHTKCWCDVTKVAYRKPAVIV